MTMFRDGNRDSSVIPFHCLITYFCEQAGVELPQEDSIRKQDKPCNSHTFKEISIRRNQDLLPTEESRKRQRVHQRATDATMKDDEEDPGAVPALEQRPAWVDELLEGQRQLSERQTEVEKQLADL
ncbi:hypothetical protein Dsin_014194 [Dipteronia sinensis]|uniref:Uncharacterized protein n=1 Tax=Dipteronia sinensis TaxID=43782 RepID=A0AAE0E9T7_9ROSI|nr:hypothetical protein Dsin_014194 [Dipteronia sinensis]